VKKAFQQLTLYLLFIFMLFYNNGIGMVHIKFLLNRQYIANNLCENRSKPQMNCKGKCYLKKQMQQESRDPGQDAAMLKNFNIELFFPEQYQTVQEPVNTALFTAFFPLNQTLHLSGYVGMIFHPPPVNVA